MFVADGGARAGRRLVTSKYREQTSELITKWPKWRRERRILTKSGGTSNKIWVGHHAESATEDSRRFFFWRVKRRVLQDFFIKSLQKADKNLSHKEGTWWTRQTTYQAVKYNVIMLMHIYIYYIYNMFM